MKEHNYQLQFTPDVVGICKVCGVKKEEHPSPCEHVLADGLLCKDSLLNSILHTKSSFICEIEGVHRPHLVGADCECANGARCCGRCTIWSLNADYQCRGCNLVFTNVQEAVTMTTNDCKCVNGIKAGCPVHENEYLDELMDYARSLGKPVFVFNSEGLIEEDVNEVKKKDI